MILTLTLSEGSPAITIIIIIIIIMIIINIINIISIIIIVLINIVIWGESGWLSAEDLLYL